MILRRALVTGAARGIGYAFSEELARRGVEVVGVDRDPIAHFPFGPAEVLDVTDAGAFRSAVDRLEAARGPIDLLVNNAGMMILGAFLDLDDGPARSMLEVNLFGVINGMKAVLPRMLSRRSGAVLNVASLVAKIPAPHASMYSASKAAVAALTEAVRLEHQGSGVILTCGFPAFTATELILGTDPPRWPAPSPPQKVAADLLDAVSKGAAEVYSPTPGFVAQAGFSVLPGGVRSSLARLLGVDRMFRDLDAEARRSYDARTRSR
ncbi:MAG: SDR family NAD(P)-dependent oxidoreductase [Deltaproteobacteria bacterium]|nr:SDR family NAD(P)-dependent oxidoreductase [Deltaproteobacteria bacterium]